MIYTYGIYSVSVFRLLIVSKALQVSSVPTVMTTPRAIVNINPLMHRSSSINADHEKLHKIIEYYNILNDFS